MRRISITFHIIHLTINYKKQTKRHFIFEFKLSDKCKSLNTIYTFLSETEHVEYKVWLNISELGDQSQKYSSKQAYDHIIYLCFILVNLSSDFYIYLLLDWYNRQIYAYSVALKSSDVNLNIRTKPCTNAILANHTTVIAKIKWVLLLFSIQNKLRFSVGSFEFASEIIV